MSQLFPFLSTCCFQLVMRLFCVLDDHIHIKYKKLEKEAKIWGKELCIYFSSAIMKVIKIFKIIQSLNINNTKSQKDEQ